MGKKLVFVCQNVDCRARKAAEVLEKLMADLAGDPALDIRPYMCFGACHEGPNVVIYPDKVWYAGVQPENVSQIVAYLRGAGPPTPLGNIDPALKERIFLLLDAGLY